MATKSTGTNRTKAQSNGTSAVSKNGAKANGAAKTKSERQRQIEKANAHLLRALQLSYWKEDPKDDAAENNDSCQK